MLPYGKLKDVSGTQTQVMSQLIDGLGQAGCEVTRANSSELEVLVPGWDGALFPSETLLPFQRYFWDKMTISVNEDGIARYRLAYFGGAQLFMHLLISVAFAFEVWFGSAATGGRVLDPLRFFLNFSLAHLLPVFLTLVSFGFSRRAVLKKAFA
jgi:hypothetical protein